MVGPLDQRYDTEEWDLATALVVFGTLGGGIALGSTLLDSRGLLLVAVAFTLVVMVFTMMVLVRVMQPLLPGV